MPARLGVWPAESRCAGTPTRSRREAGSPAGFRPSGCGAGQGAGAGPGADWPGRARALIGRGSPQHRPPLRVVPSAAAASWFSVAGCSAAGASPPWEPAPAAARVGGRRAHGKGRRAGRAQRVSGGGVRRGRCPRRGVSHSPGTAAACEPGLRRRGGGAGGLAPALACGPQRQQRSGVSSADGETRGPRPRSEDGAEPWTCPGPSRAVLPPAPKPGASQQSPVSLFTSCLVGTFSP